MEAQTEELDHLIAAEGPRERSSSGGGGAVRKVDHNMRMMIKAMQWSAPPETAQCQTLRQMVEMHEDVRVVEEEVLTQNQDGSRKHKRRRTLEKTRRVRVATEIGRSIHNHRHMQNLQKVKIELLQILPPWGLWFNAADR